MPVSLVNIFYDSLSFATATSAWTNSDLTSLAPDGWYSEVGIFRRQYLGVLGPVQTCPSCILSCGAAVSGVGTVGTYDLDFSLGTDIGAVVVKFLPSNIPDKATWTYDGVVLNCGDVVFVGVVEPVVVWSREWKVFQVEGCRVQVQVWHHRGSAAKATRRLLVVRSSATMQGTATALDSSRG